MPRVAYAGAFLTAPGGYPVGRSWAPAAIVREVTDPSAHPGVAGGAATAVDEQVVVRGIRHQGRPQRAGRARCSMPPPWPRSSQAARAHGLPVVAHVAGRRDGAARDRRGNRRPRPHPVHRGARMPHSSPAPWPAASDGSRRSTSIATMRGAAADRARRTSPRSSRAGGTVLYGTDLGNGDLPVGHQRARARGPARCGPPRRGSARRRSPIPGRARTGPHGVCDVRPGRCRPPTSTTCPRGSAARRSSPPRS